jgi:hypothetical protein
MAIVFDLALPFTPQLDRAAKALETAKKQFAIKRPGVAHHRHLLGPYLRLIDARDAHIAVNEIVDVFSKEFPHIVWPESYGNWRRAAFEYRIVVAQACPMDTGSADAKIR